MVAPEPPRRSSRRPKPKLYSEYVVGDIVEVTRNGLQVQGRLVYKLSEGPTANPRWLVTFDGETWKDEELYEKSFGKVIEKADDNDGSDSVTGKASGGSKNKDKKKNSSKYASNSKSGSSSSEMEDEHDHDDIDNSSYKKKKAVAFNDDDLGLGSEGDSSPPQDGGKVSAREQRSLRRQAKIHEEVVLPPGSNGGQYQGGNSKRKLGFEGGISKNNFFTSNGLSNKKARKDEEVVKIPMLTGTLYLYHGAHRRAEFVRRY